MQANVIITFTNFTNETVHVRMDGRNVSGVEERDLRPGDHMRARATRPLLESRTSRA